MASAPYQFLSTPPVSATFYDPSTISNALSRGGYPLAASVFLLTGLFFSTLLLAAFLSGRACAWCRYFDAYSTELYVVRESEDALAAPPAGFDQHPGYANGARAKGFDAMQKRTLFGGTLFWAALVAGFALSGDCIANIVATSR